MFGQFEMRQREEPKSKNIIEHFKMERKKKISHQAKVHPQISNNSRFCITEIRESPKRNLLDGIQDQQNTEYQQKSIKWRSPLIYSPPVKFSPKFEFQSNPEHKTNDGSYTESSESNSSNNNTLTLDIQKTPKETKIYKNPLTKQRLKVHGTKFLLSDNAYKGNQANDSNETLQTKDEEQLHKYSDLCSTSFLENFGMSKNNKTTPRQYKQEASNAMEYYTQLMPTKLEQQNDRQVSKSLNTSADKENIMISDIGSSVSQRPANNTSSNVLSPVIQRNLKFDNTLPRRIDPNDFILAQNKTISQNSMRSLPIGYVHPKMTNYYNSDMERNWHFKHLNRTPNLELRSDYYGNNSVEVPNMSQFYPTQYPSTDYSVPLHLNHSMYFPQCPEDFQYSHRPVPYHRFDLVHSDENKGTLDTWYYPQMDPTYNKHVFGEQKYCQEPNMTYSQPLRTDKNEISLQNDKLITNTQAIRKPSQDVRKVFCSQDDYYNDSLQYRENFESKVKKEHVQPIPSIEGTRTSLSPVYFYRTNPDLNRSFSSRYQVPPNVGHYELPNYPRPPTHLDTRHFKENVCPCYGIPRESQYIRYSPNDKEYVMNKFLYSLNEDR